MQTFDESFGGDRPWWAARGFVASAAFLALLAIAATGILAFGGGGGDTVVRRAPRVVAGKPVDTGGSMCGLPVGNTAMPVTAPPATWKFVGHVAVPTNPNIGPGVVHGSWRVCFAHNATGAVFAAMNAIALAGLDIPNTTEAKRVTAHVLATTPARDVLLKQSADSGAVSAADTTEGGGLAIAGFRVESMQRDLVLVSVAMSLSGHAGLVATSMAMRWEQRAGADGGDWRWLIEDPQNPYAGGVIDSTDGYVMWTA